jgi:hypothetical protein
MKKYLLAPAGFIALLMLVLPVQASILVPGAPPVPLDPITGLPAGSIVSNGGTVTVTPFVSFEKGGAVFSGTAYLAVYQEAATGFLDFLFQVQLNKSSLDAFTRQTSLDFRPAAGFVDATYIRSFGPVPPGFLHLKTETVPTSADLSSNGSTVGFTFGHGDKGLGPGTTSVVYMIRTHVKGFGGGSSTLINREVPAPVPSFAPNPEPSTLILFGGCFVGLAGWTGWHRWKSKSFDLSNPR